MFRVIRVFRDEKLLGVRLEKMRAYAIDRYEVAFEEASNTLRISWANFS